ncbi:MAG TPA: hypothetical protein VG457_03215 [Planctomycetota bacterium]|jgi:hypothetical protein|nr:hypothetical protein [Planctomycetota bacterium]
MKTEPLKDLVAGLDLQTDLWWLAMILTGFLATFLAAFGFPGAGSFFVWLAVLVRLAIVAGVSQQPYGAVFVRLLPLGLVVGCFAIFGDHMLVNWSDRAQRVYPEHSGVLLSSPLYLPLLWSCLFIEFGYTILRIYGLIAKHLTGDLPFYGAMLLGGLIAALWTACTDFWAVKAKWWSYQTDDSVILGGACALYVVIATFFIFCAFLPLFLGYLSCSGSRIYASVRYGLIFGLVIFVSYVVAHLLVEHKI